MEIREECGRYLAECYRDLFFGNVDKHYRAMTDTKLRECLSWLVEVNLESLVKSNKLSDVHAMLSEVCAYLMRREGHLMGSVLKQWESSCRQMRGLYGALARKDLECVNGLSREDLEQVLKMQGIYRYPLINSLERTYQLLYAPRTIKRGILGSIKQKSEQEHPGARETKHMFILRVSPVNSGKIHDALERLKEYRHGAHFGPLRLLALEVYDKFNTKGPSYSMVTGEEISEAPGVVCQPCTMGMLNDHEYFDTVMMDECQIIADFYREHNWTRTVLEPRAEEIHLCTVPEAKDIVVQMVKRYGDRYRMVRHKKSTRLTVEKRPYNLKRDLKEDGALVVFSRKSVLALTTHLENEGIHCSVICESLPPATGCRQVRRLLTRETEMVVSTDTIGMRLNPPIRRIVSVETRKFDGVDKRTLSPEEIKQIAGWAGRYGLHDEGSVAAISEAEVIEDGLSRMPMPIVKAYVGLPEQLLNLPAETGTLVKIWVSTDTPSIYEKMEVDGLLALYMSFKRVHRGDMEEYPWQEIYKLITYSIDIDNEVVMGLRRDYCREHRDVTKLEFPYSPGEDLYELESYHKVLDLYFRLSRKMGLPVQAESLTEERHGIEEEINRILRTECASYTRKCSACGKELSWDYPFFICGRCFERGKISRRHDCSGRRHAAGNRI